MDKKIKTENTNKSNNTNSRECANGMLGEGRENVHTLFLTNDTLPDKVDSRRPVLFMGPYT